MTRHDKALLNDESRKITGFTEIISLFSGAAQANVAKFTVSMIPNVFFVVFFFNVQIYLEDYI